MRSVIGWQQTWWQWCGDDRKSSAVCQKKRGKDTGSQGSSRRAEDDARSSKKQERGEAGREREWKINRLGEQWEAKKTGHRKKKKELQYLWLSQHCVEVECLGGAPMFGTIIWHGVDPSQEIYAIWLDACIHKCLTLAQVHTFLHGVPPMGNDLLHSLYSFAFLADVMFSLKEIQKLEHTATHWIFVWGA